MPRPATAAPARGPARPWTARWPTGAPGMRVAVAAAVVGLLGVAGPLGVVVVDASPAAAAGSCTGPLAPGEIRVVVVVDPGETGPSSPRSTCLVVAAGTPGSQILAQRAAELGLPAPRYAGSGLLCGLDGFPATVCPVNTGGTYAYWAYFNGVGGGWSYGYDNPFVRRMADGEIMGWRYTAASRDGEAPMPRLAPSSSLFPPLTPATTTPTTAPPATAAPAPVPEAAAPAPSGGSTAGGDASVVDGPGAGAAGSLDAGSTATSVEPGTESPDEAKAASSATGRAGATSTATGEELAAAPASSTSAGAGRWIGPAIAVAVVGALVAGAVTRARARARP